jgi:hypothetical protein
MLEAPPAGEITMTLDELEALVRCMEENARAVVLMPGDSEAKIVCKMCQTPVAPGRIFIEHKDTCQVKLWQKKRDEERTRKIRREVHGEDL